MQAQSKSMKSTWLYSCGGGGGGGGRVKFSGTKKRLAGSKELNMLAASIVTKALKMRNKSNDTATDKSDL